MAFGKLETMLPVKLFEIKSTLNYTIFIAKVIESIFESIRVNINLNIINN